MSAESEMHMNSLEKRASFGLAGIFAMRMLGLFMILPVMSIYADQLTGTTPLLLGLAISMYGLTQALFQIPFGMLSDKVGRKRMILIGLVLFAAGSVVAAASDSIMGVIVGRALQGCGAVAAVIMALAADLTREHVRTKAMATIGISIGLSFAVSMVAGPIVGQVAGLQGIFWLTALLAVCGMAIVIWVVPNPQVSHLHREAVPVPALFKRVLNNPDLLRLDLGIFSLHLIMTAQFVVVPLILKDVLDIPGGEHWMIYLPVLVVAVAGMVPLVILAEKKRQMKPVFLGAVATLMIANGLLYFTYDHFWGMVSMLLLFFVAFNLLEATLPSMISKLAKPEAKGTAMGVYSSSQFFGAFCGGLIGGWVYGAGGLAAVFLVCAIVAAIWLFFSWDMSPPRHLSNLIRPVQPENEVEAQLLMKEFLLVDGVVEAFVSAEEGVAYLKVDKQQLDQSQLDQKLATAS